MTLTAGRGTARMLRDKANERRRVGWEISDVMTPREIDAVADEIERLEAQLTIAADILRRYRKLPVGGYGQLLASGAVDSAADDFLEAQ